MKSLVIFATALLWLSFHLPLATPFQVAVPSRHSPVARRRTATTSSLFGVLHPNYAENVAAQVQPSVVLVTPMGVRNMTTRGTGFVIDFASGEDAVYLLTAAHVATPGMKLEVEFPMGSKETIKFPATIVQRKVEADLAIIQVETTEDFHFPKALTLDDSSTPPPIGTLAFAHGYPGGLAGPAMTSGIVCAAAEGVFFSQPQPNASRTSYVVTDAAMAGGMSGGPLVNVNGTVLGVNALVRPDLRALGNYAISASECLDFIQEAQQQQRDDSSTATTTNNTAFQVVIYNDPMNTRARVAKVLAEVAQLNETSATAAMMEAHTTGRGVVQVFDSRDSAETLRNAIQQQDVLVEVEAVG